MARYAWLELPLAIACVLALSALAAVLGAMIRDAREDREAEARREAAGWVAPPGQDQGDVAEW